MRKPFPQARIDEITAEWRERMAAAEVDRGSRCSCCSKPLQKVYSVPTECPECRADTY